MTAVLLRIAGPFGTWILTLALLPVAGVFALRDMAVEAWRKRRQRKREEAQTAGQVRDFRRELQEWQ